MKNSEKFKSLPNKLEAFQSIEAIKEYAETYTDIEEAAKYLSENERYQILKLEYIKNRTSTSDEIIKSIKDEQLKIRILNDEEIFAKDTPGRRIVNIVLEMTDEGKEAVLRILSQKNESEGVGRFSIQSFYIKDIITSMSLEKITQIILDTNLTEQLGLQMYEKVEIVKVLKDDHLKEEIMQKYDFHKMYQAEIIKTFSTEAKVKRLEQDAEKLGSYNVIGIINSLDIDDKLQFIKSHGEFLQNNDITVFDIVRDMRNKENSSLQLEFVYRLEELALTEGEKRAIIAGIENETKEKIDASRIEPRYADLLQIRLFDSGFDLKEMLKSRKIIPDLSGDITQYKDLDELIYINPVLDKCDDAERQRIIELCRLCPNATVYDELSVTESTGTEFVQAEAWIDSVLKQLKPEWKDIQKMAFIDTQIGKKISFTPEQNTEVEDMSGERSLWKIIANENGVCIGIAQIEKYMFERIGIESEIVSANTHAFLMVKGVEIPTETGETVKGDTLIDPTWNLSSSRFGAFPQHFCKTYEELRKFDIDDNGNDHNSHRKDELEHVPLIGMDEDTIRKVCSSIGLADEKGNFPIKSLIEETKKIDDSAGDFEEKIRKKFNLLKSSCPEFAKCINSTLSIIRGVLFQDCSQFHYDRCIASRVFDKNDPREKSGAICIFRKRRKKKFLLCR